MSSRIYTRRGDAGQTALADGTQVPKDSPRVQAYGAIDEANAWIGVARAWADDALLDRTLELVQHRFYNCSSNLAIPAGTGYAPPTIADDDVAFLERAIDRFEEQTGAVSCFVLPGGSRSAAMLHVARTVCRRAERRVVTLARSERVDPLVRTFLNRASDFLFAAARYANCAAGSGDVAWRKDLPLPQIQGS